MSWKVAPPSVDDCHCTVGAGTPAAAAVNEYAVPAGTDVSPGCVVTDGTAVGTTEFDALDGALEPITFRAVTVHVYGAPAVSPVTAIGLDVFVPEPLTPPPLDVHCAVESRIGLPPSSAGAVNRTFAPPTRAVALPTVGECGATATTSVAAALVVVPDAFVNTARSSCPESASAPVPVYESAVAPAMFVNVDPASVEICHCCAGAG
jgi:hypothetical protein